MQCNDKGSLRLIFGVVQIYFDLSRRVLYILLVLQLLAVKVSLISRPC